MPPPNILLKMLDAIGADPELMDTSEVALADELQEVLEEELERIAKARRPRWWAKPSISRRDEFGASSTLLNEWSQESPERYESYL